MEQLKEFLKGKTTKVTINKEEWNEVTLYALPNVVVCGQEMTPVYYVKKDSAFSPDSLELYGYIYENDLYVASKYLYPNIEGTIPLTDYKREEYEARLINKLYNAIEPLVRDTAPIEMNADFKKSVEHQFRLGEVAISDEEYVKREIDFIIKAIQKNGEMRSSRTVFELLEFIVDEEAYLNNRVRALVDVSNICDKVACTKARNLYLRELEQQPLDKIVVLRRVFNELHEKGTRNVNVKFDFGFIQLDTKVDTGLSEYSFIEGVHKKTDEFYAKCDSPLLRTDYYREVDDFLPFITEISYRKTVLYEDTFTVDHLKERELCTKAYKDYNEVSENNFEGIDWNWEVNNVPFYKIMLNISKNVIENGFLRMVDTLIKEKVTTLEEVESILSTIYRPFSFKEILISTPAYYQWRGAKWFEEKYLS